MIYRSLRVVVTHMLYNAHTMIYHNGGAVTRLLHHHCDVSLYVQNSYCNSVQICEGLFINTYCKLTNICNNATVHNQFNNFYIIGSTDGYIIYSIYDTVVMAWWIRIRNLYCPYSTEKHQGTRKYTNKDIWTPTRYKQTKKLRENTKQCYNIIKYNVEQNDDEMALLISWHMPQTIAAIIPRKTQNPTMAPMQWHDMTALIMSRSATATTPQRIMWCLSYFLYYEHSYYWYILEKKKKCFVLVHIYLSCNTVVFALFAWSHVLFITVTS